MDATRLLEAPRGPDQLEGQLSCGEQTACAETGATDRRAVFLAEASRQLAASLDYETTLAGVARLAVPELADWCLIDVVEADRSVRKVAVAHADPAKEPLVCELRRYAPRPAGPHPTSQALHTGRPELVGAVTEAWLAAHASDEAHLRLLRAIGVASVMVVPLLARGQTLGILTFLSAESGRRYAPADLALAEELARRAAVAVDNARLYQEAQRAAREAQEAVRARDEFLARASHELRTPLTSALGTIRLLKRALTGALKERPEELVDIASRSLGAMAVLVDNLLDASKLAASTDPLLLEPVELAAIVRESLEIVGAQAREKGVAVRVASPSGLTLPADRLRLEQVLVNLLANAIKFTPAGGEVTLETQAEADFAVIRVRDTGKGIPREHLERIFEPFFQGEEPGSRPSRDRRARRVRGVGLGLAICRQIVALHGGAIRADSDGPGRGSTFTVRLALAPPKEPTA